MKNVTNYTAQNSNQFIVLKILNYIRKNANSSVSMISQETNTVLPTVYRNIPILEANGLVSRENKESADVGRKAWQYSINKDAGHMLGISLSKYTVAVVLSDLNGNLLEYREERLKSKLCRNEILSIIESLVEEIMTALYGSKYSFGRFDLICFMVAGEICMEKGIIERYVEYPVLDGFHLQDYFSQRYGVETLVTKITLVGVFSSLKKMREEGINSYASLVLGEGIGAGLVVNGKLYLGSHNRVGEISDILLPEGNETLEGRYNCSILSERLKQYFATPEAKQNEELMKIAAQYDPDIISGSFQQFLSSLDTFIREHPDHPVTSIINFFTEGWALIAYYLYVYLDPEAVILSGFINSSTPTIVDMIQEHLKNKNLPCDTLKVSEPFTNRQWLEGLALYYLDELFQVVCKKKLGVAADPLSGTAASEYSFAQLRQAVADKVASMSLQEKKEIIEALLTDG